MTGAGDSAPPLTRSVKLWYGLGQFAEGLKAEAFALLLLFYYTSVAGLAGELAGAPPLIARDLVAALPGALQAVHTRDAGLIHRRLLAG